MIREAKIDELTLDENNANVGTERGAEVNCMKDICLLASEVQG